MLQRYYLQEEPFIHFTLSPEQSHHLKNVVRKKVGSKVVVCWQGEVFEATVLDYDRSGLAMLERGSRLPSPDNPLEAWTVAFSVPKGERAELLLAGLAQLGVSRVVPLLCERTVKNAFKEKKRERWERVVEHHSGVAGHSCCLEIGGLLSLEELIEGSEGTQVWVAHEEASCGLKDLSWGGEGEHLLLVGPEGGLSPREIKYLKDFDATLFTLGSFNLTVEYAAVVAVSSLLQRWDG